MRIARSLDITELIKSILDPTLEEPDYVSSSHLAIELLTDAWAAQSGRDLPTVQDACRTFRAALVDEGDISPAQVGELATKLCPAPVGDLHDWLADAAERLLLRIRPWIPIWVGFTWWSFEWCRHTKRQQVIFLGRDGLPFYTAAGQFGGDGPRVRLLDAPRRLLGSPLFESHLDASIDCGDPVAFVDTGCYGTVITALARHHNRRCHDPNAAGTLFLSSRNPRIFGYLNYLMSCRLMLTGPCSAPDPMDFTIYACDVTEALPKPYTVDIGAGGLRRVPADVASFVLSMKVCVEIARYARCHTANPSVDAAVAADELCQMFQNTSSALLLKSCAPKNPPTGPTWNELNISGIPPQSEIFGVTYG